MHASWRFYLAATAMVLLSGCTKCSEEKRPHVNLGTQLQEENPVPENAVTTDGDPQRPDEDRD